MITPAIIGWKYRSSSCRPRKYHGALEGFGVRLGLASSRSGAWTKVEKMITAALTMRRLMNSSISRCGKTLTRSPCSRSTRWMPSGATSARSRCLSGAPAFGVGMRPVGGGAVRTAAAGGDLGSSVAPPPVGALRQLGLEGGVEHRLVHRRCFAFSHRPSPLHRSADPAVLPDTPEVDGQEQHEDER